MENISFDDHTMGVNNPTTAAHMMALYVFLFLIVEIPGNLLLLSMICYEKYGMDSQKRTVTNKLLTSICVIFLLQNIVVMPILMFHRIYHPVLITRRKKLLNVIVAGLFQKDFTYLETIQTQTNDTQRLDCTVEIFRFFKSFKS